MSSTLSARTIGPQPVQTPHELRGQTALTILLTDKDEAAQWRFDVYTTGIDGGRSYVGSFETLPVGTGHKSRVIGTVVQLGAQGWVVHAFPAGRAPNPDAIAIASIMFGHGFFPGVIPNGPLATVVYV